MGTEGQDNELTDVVLCYQALGIPLDASPAQIEQVFKVLTDRQRRLLSEPDSVTRSEAQRSLDQIAEMYDKIRGSVTYRTAEKDFEKKGVLAQEAKRPQHQAVAEKKKMVNCPRCNGLIKPGLQVCPICRTRIYTPAEKLLQALFSTKMLLLYAVLLILAGSAFYFLSSRTAPAKAPASELDSLQNLQAK